MQSCARGDSCGVVYPRAKANGEDDEMMGRVQPRLLSRVYSSILCVYCLLDGHAYLLGGVWRAAAGIGESRSGQCMRESVWTMHVLGVDGRTRLAMYTVDVHAELRLVRDDSDVRPRSLLDVSFGSGSDVHHNDGDAARRSAPHRTSVIKLYSSTSIHARGQRRAVRVR